MLTDLSKDLSMRIFLGHLVAYVAVTLICAAVNLWLTPGTLWFPWVLMGWGIAVATHALALLLRKTHRRERIFIDKCARSFTVHLFAYVAVVLLLFFVNLTVTPKVWWFYLGGTRLGRGAYSAWLERLLQAATACRNDRAAEDRDDLKAEFTCQAEQAHQAELRRSLGANSCAAWPSPSSATS